LRPTIAVVTGTEKTRVVSAAATLARETEGSNTTVSLAADVVFGDVDGGYDGVERQTRGTEVADVRL
jgi:hypothetical protein